MEILFDHKFSALSSQNSKKAEPIVLLAQYPPYVSTIKTFDYFREYVLFWSRTNCYEFYEYEFCLCLFSIFLIHLTNDEIQVNKYRSERKSFDRKTRDSLFIAC